MHLVGLTHPNRVGGNRISDARTLEMGTRLVLVPEADNAYDRNAILINREGDLRNDIGYLDYAGARQICKLMERGATFSAEVNWINNDNPDLPKVYLCVTQLTEPIRRARPMRRNAPKYPSRFQEQSPDDTTATASGGYIVRFIRRLFGF
jgi:HIRAN domain-containing protein